MAGTVQFTRDYAAFGNQVKPYEKSDDVGLAVTGFLSRWGYPIRALINAKIAGIWLGEGEKPAGDTDNIDLIFKMAEPGQPYFEIVLRSGGGMAAYGGYAFGDSLEVTDEIVNAHRVLITTFPGEKLRFEYVLDHPEGPQYSFVGPAAGSALSTAAARKAHRKSR